MAMGSAAESRTSGPAKEMPRSERASTQPGDGRVNFARLEPRRIPPVYCSGGLLTAMIWRVVRFVAVMTFREYVPQRGVFVPFTHPL